MFQCPTTGSSHFYGIPSQTPIKPAFPGTISGGISQNILKIKVLPTKNGMFTICSYFTCFYSTIIPIFMQAVISFLKHIENKKYASPKVLLQYPHIFINDLFFRDNIPNVSDGHDQHPFPISLTSCVFWTF